MSSEPLYYKSKTYLQTLTALLPEDNALRVFIGAEVELAVLFSKGLQEVRFPICGETGVIGSHHIAALMHGFPLAALEALSVERVWEKSSTLQRIAGGNSITLSGLH